MTTTHERNALTFKIQRTRLITEVFRVTAATEEEAYGLLGDCDRVETDGDKVEQLELSTHHSTIDSCECEGEA